MGTPLGPKYIPYTYMDPLGLQSNAKKGSACISTVAIVCHQGRGFRVRVKTPERGLRMG